MNDVPCSTREAFREVARVAVERAGEAAWAAVLAEVSPEIRAALDQPESDDALFAELLTAADDRLGDGDGSFALAVGEARALAKIGDGAEWAGDPLRMLRDATPRFYEDRTNFGAASVEVTTSKAIVRFVVAEAFARKESSRGWALIQGFLERAVEIVTTERQSARYVGQTPRVDGRFDRPMYNAIFEFDLES